MTKQLENLVKEWIEEKEAFKRASERYLSSVNLLVTINDALYKKAKEEGLAIDEAIKLYNHANISENLHR